MSLLTIWLAVGSVLLFAVLATILLVLKDAAAKEAAAVLPEFTRNLIGRAKDQLPDGARQRFEEEWSAGFEEAIEKRPAWALVQAISLYRGARQIARELEPVTASSSAGRTGWGSIAVGTAKLSGWASAARNSRPRRWATRIAEAVSGFAPMKTRNLRHRMLLGVLILYIPLVLRTIFDVRLFSAPGAIVLITCICIAAWLQTTDRRR